MLDRGSPPDDWASLLAAATDPVARAQFDAATKKC